MSVCERCGFYEKQDENDDICINCSERENEEMSMPSREEERHNYFVNELKSRFTNDEILKHFADLMRQRMRKGDEAMMDWALDYMIEHIDPSDALDEVADAIGFEEIDV